MKIAITLFMVSLSLFGSEFAPMGGSISKIDKSQKIFVTCVSEVNGVCEREQFVLEGKDGSQELIGAEFSDLSGAFVTDLFLSNEGCYRIKPCLKDRFAVGSKKFMRMTAPYALTQMMGERKLNEAMIGTVPVDTILLPVLLPVHGTIAIISVLRKGMFKKIAKNLVSGNKKMAMRQRHFKGLVEEINLL